jgi:hypothetical protein
LFRVDWLFGQIFDQIYMSFYPHWLRGIARLAEGAADDQMPVLPVLPVLPVQLFQLVLRFMLFVRQMAGTDVLHGYGRAATAERIS